MSKNSAIEWTHHTFNPWWGCSKVSPGCKNCYAEILAHRFKTEWGVHGVRKAQSEKYWRQPIHWNEAARKSGEHHRVFCGSMCDIFEDNPQVEGPRQRVMELALETPHLNWLFLTKRPQFAREWLEEWKNQNSNYCPRDILPPHFWIGTSVESQETADERIPYLLRIPARIRFLSCEPLLGAIDLWRYMVLTNDNDDPDHYEEHGWRYDSWSGAFMGPGAIDSCYDPEPGISWVIAGGESGPKARPMHLDWARSLRDQCQKADVPFFFKQWGRWVPSGQLNGADYGTKGFEWPNDNIWSWSVGKKAAGRLLDGREWNQVPIVHSSEYARYMWKLL